ncbi:MAG: tetraacyldisaccharide 4'-kinase [Sideroxydans sp.]|nr:tetraacyldisaccharide 4'-kinase [Sideroxydans sp.]
MFDLQRHWYRITPLHIILLPVSWLFGALAATRRILFRTGIFSRTQLNVPVIIVGNISVGGTGKTPLTLALAAQLIAHGKHPVIISRGYGGTRLAPQAVTPSSTAAQVGDEPLLMAQRNLCPVWIGRNRVATALAARAAHPECDVILCDDGLQHYRLQRDVEIVVVDAARQFGNQFLLPAGPLRESVARLKSVDAIVYNGGTQTDSAKQFAMQLQGEIFYNLLTPSRTATALELQGLRCHAIAGIGNPARYFAALNKLGLTCTNHAFADHHAYTAAELNYADCDALLLTEKDAVKCAPFADARYWVLRVEAQIPPALIELILRKMQHHGCKTA